MAMEVSVLEAQNAPSSAYIAISSGSVRQQVHLELGKPLIFPAQEAEGKGQQISVSLFEQLGTATMDVGVEKKAEAEGVFVVPVTSGKGVTTEVKLRARYPDKRSQLCPSPNGSGNDEVTTNGYAQVLNSASWQRLGRDDLQYIVQNLLQEVCRDRPEQPYAFMAGRLKQHRAQEGEAREQAVSMLNGLFAKLNETLGPTFPERAKAAKEARAKQ